MVYHDAKERGFYAIQGYYTTVADPGGFKGPGLHATSFRWNIITS